MKSTRPKDMSQATTVITFRCECGQGHEVRLPALKGGIAEVTCGCGEWYKLDVSGCVKSEECN